MAAIRKHGNKWQAQIRKAGQRPISKSFTTKANALTWAKTIESELERGIYIDRTQAEKTTISDILSRYEIEILPTLRGGKSDRYILKLLHRHLGAVSLASINPSHLALFRNNRLENVCSQTVKRELGLLNRVLKRAHYHNTALWDSESNKPKNTVWT